MYIIAALLLLFISVAHSYLGERYILMRLFQKGNLPKLYNSETFTKNTLRFAWHLTSVAWIGFAVILIALEMEQFNAAMGANIIAVVFFLHGMLALFFSKGKHFSWWIFLAIGALSFAASYF